MHALSGAARYSQPDVLHVQCFSSNGAYATALSAYSGIPLLISLQGETLMDDQDIYTHSASLRLALRLGLRQAQAVTACSSFVLGDAKRRFALPPGSGTVVANGVEIDEPATADALSVPFPRFVFGVGRIVHKKGFDLLLEAFSEVAGDSSDVGLVIGGDGDARVGLVNRAGELGLADRVLFPGILSRPQVNWAMREAAAFVLPSRLEPFGIVVLEALAGGCPVVVSSRGGAPEIVRDGREGLVVDPYDTTTMARAMRRVLDDDRSRRCFIAAGRARVRDFAWKHVTEQYRAIYRSVSST
jgi:glycogen(starch) synthase